MKMIYLLAASFAILCGKCVLSVTGAQQQVTLRKCCPMETFLDYKHDCAENRSDRHIEFDEGVLKKIQNTSKSDMVNYDIEVVKNVTGNQCDPGKDYIARVLAVLTNDSLVLDLMNTQVITQKYSCIDKLEGNTDLIAIVCHDTIATKKGLVHKCCPHGEAVNEVTRQCEDKGDEDASLFNPPVRSRWTGLPTQVFDVKHIEFASLCESGHSVSTRVEGVTSDGFVYNDTSQAEVEYGCVDMLQGDLIAWTCTGKSACQSSSCVEKCCKPDEILDEYFYCVKAYNNSHLWSTDNLAINVTGMILRHSFFQDITHGHPRLSKCPRVYFLDPDEDYQITGNGSLSHENHALTQDYCIENVKQNETVVTKVIRCIVATIFEVEKSSSNATVALGHGKNDTFLAYISICGIISLFCLVFTLLVYCIIPGFNTLHGKIVQSNIISITILTIFILIVFNADNRINRRFCTVLGFSGYFSSISMFSWMTIMCFDLYWTFSRSELPSATSDRFKFRLYSVIGWGTALILTATLAVLQFGLPRESEVNPAIGERSCFISNDGKRRLYLFYIPMLFIMLFNSLVFIAIIILLVIAKKSTKEARLSTRTKDSTKSTQSRVNSDTKEQLALYMKLFFVLGILWGFEGIHAIIHNDQECPNLPSDLFFRAIDILNILRGVFIFVIFICKRTVWTKIMRYYRQKSGQTANQGTMSSLTHSSMTSGLTSQTIVNGYQMGEIKLEMKGEVGERLKE